MSIIKYQKQQLADRLTVDDDEDTTDGEDSGTTPTDDTLQP